MNIKPNGKSPFRSRPLVLSLIFLIGASIGHAQSDQGSPAGSPADQAPDSAALKDLIDRLYTQWDTNHDGKLDVNELTAAIGDPQVRGLQAAVAVLLYNSIAQAETDKLHEQFKDYKTNKAENAAMHAQQKADEEKVQFIARDDALALAAKAPVDKKLFRRAKHVQSINHALFAPGDPNLQSFHQGGMGDCYLLAVIGAYVRRDPQAVRRMIQQNPDGTYYVHFTVGEDVTVRPLTDAELLMGAREGSDHGVWLSVLEKAYGHIAAEQKERKTGQEVDADADIPSHLMGRGGSPGIVITIMTGHKTAGMPLSLWVKKDPAHGLDKADALLAKVCDEHRLMAVSTRAGVQLPKGIPHGHCLSVFGYDSASRTVTVFNPWGNSVKPVDPPGLVNGYPTTHGVFQVPLADFIKIFAGFCYETNRPATAD
ncbi:MAG: C2 family cysteine protease [Chthoniobacteraceae bacterium]